MNKLTTFTLLILLSKFCFSQGDTIVINAHDETHMNWYGKWDNMVEFPDANVDYHKVLLDVTLGCPSGGCSDWDYTVKFELLHNTHELDSTLTLAPNFTVNNEVVDSFNFNLSPTFTNVFNQQTSSTVQVQNDSVWIQLFNSNDDPFLQTDSIKAWPAGYFNYLFNENGEISDSMLIEADSNWIVEFTEIYDVYEVIIPFELARLMTPYAGNYSNSWKHTFTFDVTDFLPLMQDSAIIRVFYGGWQDGFTASLNFKFIEGTPARKPLAIQNIYSSGMGGFKYGNPDADIEEYLTTKKLSLESDAVFSKIRYTASGHSFGGAENCAEFCPKNYYLYVENQIVDTQLIWKPCGVTALYPQAGTWLYDRAGWCPGDRTDTYEHEVSEYIFESDSTYINVDMDPYTYDFNAGFHPNYIVESQFVQYGPMNFVNEASIEEIIAPNKDPRYSRNNPFGTRPLIRIKNNGNEVLNSLTFNYNIENGEVQDYHWQGEIDPLQSAVIELPSIKYDLNYNNQDDLRKFSVSIENPNGVEDEWIYNNESNSMFDPPSVYNEFFFIEFYTNKEADENYLEILNAEGEVVFSKENMESSTKYRDTLNLEEGFYELVLTDEGGDGIGFWANPDAGMGYIGFYRGVYDHIEKLQKDFGSILYHAFYVQTPVSVNNTHYSSKIGVYPNPADNIIHIKSDFNNKAQAEITISDLSGKVLIQEPVINSNQVLDIDNLNPGIYVMSICQGKDKFTQKLIVY